MKKNKKSIAKILLLALFGFTLTNCTKESDFIGGLVEMPIIPTPPPVSDTLVTEVAQDSVVARFATRTCELYTVEQKVCGKFLKKMGDDVLDSTEFERKLDLNAMFNAPQRIYVPTADDIANVSLSTIKKGEAAVTSEEDGSEFVRFKSETPFTFVMNKGEEVVAQAYFEKDVALCSQKDLCYTAITNVQLKTANAAKNDSLSNEDSLVYDVKAIYNVDLLRHIKDTTSLEKYEVTVPYQRVHLVGDAFVGKRVGKVERKIISDSSERIIITTYEEWSLSGKINEVKDSIDLPISFSAPTLQYVVSADKAYATSTEGLQEEEETSENVGNWTLKTKPFTYTSVAQNEAGETFTNVYTGSSSAATYQKDDITLDFGYGTWNISEGETTIADVPQDVEYNGTVYDGYLYTNNIRGRYTLPDDTTAVAGASEKEVSEQATAYILLTQIPDEKLSTEIESIKREIVSPTLERVSITTYETWSKAGIKNKETESIDLPIVLNAPQKQMVLAENANFVTAKATISYGDETSKQEGNWTVKTKPFTYTSIAQNNADTSFNNVYSGSSCAVTYQKDTIKIELGYGTWTVAQEQTTIASAPQDVEYKGETYDGYAYANHLELSYNVQEAETTLPVTSEATILITKDKLLGKEGKNVQNQVVDDNTDKVTWEEVEHWSKSGDKTIQKEWIRQRHFYAPNEQTVTTLNKEYSESVAGSATIREERSTQGALMVTTRYMSYTVNFDNRLNPFSVVYNYDMQSAVYTDPDNFYTLTFDFPKWDVTENSVEISESPAREGAYNVYKHTHKVMHTYTVGNASQGGNAQALTNLKLLAKNIPDAWGTIRNFGVSVVPADDVNGHFAKKAFCLVTDSGAVAVVLDYNRDLPTVDEINKGHFVKGSYDASYNSAYWDKTQNLWKPAVARDEQKGIYYYDHNVKKAIVTYVDLGIWNGWQHGKTTVVTGYSISVQNGVLSVKAPNGSTLQLF